jgi:uncharacterized protein YqgC (DUF456 family)
MALCQGSTFLIDHIGYTNPSDYVNGLGWESAMYFLFGAVVLFSAYSTVTPLIYKNTKRFNENRLYRFQWQSFIFTMLIFVFVVIFGLVTGDRYIFNGNCAPWHSTDVGGAKFGLWSSYIGYIGLLTTFGITIVCVIVASVNNPKVDTERLNALMRQYLDEMSKAPTPGAPPPVQ